MFGVGGAVQREKQTENKEADLPALTDPGLELVYAAHEPLGFLGPDRGLVFGGWKTHGSLQLFGPHGKLSGRFRGRSIEKLGGRFAGSSREGGRPRWIQRSEA
jgi:hypothetical protein